MKPPHEKIFVRHSRYSRYTIIIDAPNLRPVSSDLSWRDAFQTLNQTSKNVVRWFQLVQNDWTIPIHKIQRKCTLCLNSNIILRFQILSSQHSGQYFEIKRCIISDLPLQQFLKVLWYIKKSSKWWIYWFFLISSPQLRIFREKFKNVDWHIPIYFSFMNKNANYY